MTAVAQSREMEEKREQGSFKHTTTDSFEESGHPSGNSPQPLGEYFPPRTRTPSRVAETKRLASVHSCCAPDHLVFLAPPWLPAELS